MPKAELMNKTRTAGTCSLPCFRYTRNCRQPTGAKILPREEYTWFDDKNSKNVSIYDGISYDKEGNEITILDVLKTENPDYAEEIYKNDNIKLLRKYLNVLTKREREVLTKRYGLDNTDEITQKEIAKELGISRSYVSRIEKRAITKILREFIRNDNSTKENS